MAEPTVTIHQTANGYYFIENNIKYLNVKHGSTHTHRHTYWRKQWPAAWGIPPSPLGNDLKVCPHGSGMTAASPKQK